MTAEDKERYSYIVNLLGKEKVEALYHYVGCKRISVTSLIRVMRKNKISTSLRSKKAVSRIASENGVTRMTIYRHLKIK